MKRTSILVITAVALVLMLALAAPAATVNCSGVAAWSGSSVAYAIGALVTYQGNEYKCLQGHTSQPGWDPVSVGALWSLQGSCGTGPTPTATPKPTASATPKPTATATATAKPTASATAKPTATPTATATAKPTATATPSGTTTGTIHFHLLLGLSSAQDSITLDGGNYTDLIMSNMVAGVMYGHLIDESFPGMQYNKDYLYGSVMGQMLQENLATGDYLASSNLLDPSSEQQAVMGVGQGGPYQINNYAVDMVSGGTAPTGHSMINYIAVQKNIGYTMANAASQSTQPTPPSFNNKYYGPILPAYFHFNDMVALNLIGKGPGGWQTPWEPEYDQTLANFVTLPNSFLDIILNVAYNQGYYGPLLPQDCIKGETATAATVTAMNSYSNAWGISDTYTQYPYQVHYYMDQIYNNPIPTTSATTMATPGNHVAFNMTTLEGVFTNVFETLSYSNGTSAAQFFSASQAQSAFNSALSAHGVSSGATLDLSSASDRATIFAVLDSAIGNLETAVGMKFNATTTSQL